MTNRQKQIEQITNVLIIVVAILVIGAVFYNVVFLKQKAKSLQNGDIFDLPNINWKEEKQTLVFVLDKDCHFCSESAGFYKKIVKNQQNKSLKLVAVFTHSTDEGIQYLQKMNVAINDVLNFRFKNGINGTPTLVLVDEFGKIVDSWEGKLSVQQEEEVLQKLNL